MLFSLIFIMIRWIFEACVYIDIYIIVNISLWKITCTLQPIIAGWNTNLLTILGVKKLKICSFHWELRNKKFVWQSTDILYTNDILKIQIWTRHIKEEKLSSRDIDGISSWENCLRCTTQFFFSVSNIECNKTVFRRLSNLS